MQLRVKSANRVSVSRLAGIFNLGNVPTKGCVDDWTGGLRHLLGRLGYISKQATVTGLCFSKPGYSDQMF